MQIDKFSRALDWLHARLPRFCRRVLATGGVMIGLGVLHLVASAVSATYQTRVFAQYADAQLQQSVLALPAGQLAMNLGVLLITAWIVLFLVRLALALRARFGRRVGA